MKSDQECKVTPSSNSLYIGSIRHRRYQKKHHEFSYQLFMMYCNIDEIDAICDQSPFWSHNRSNVASFYDADYLPSYSGTLRQKVNKVLNLHGKTNSDGDVYLLANWRYFGYLINPIACFYCFDKQGKLQNMILEVTNTPWGERINYVLSCDPDQPFQRLIFDKTMHVSPFYAMDMVYKMNCHVPGENLSIHLENWQQEEKVFDATLGMKRSPINSTSLNRILIRYPFMTMKVFTGIYWQALKLWLKGIPYIPKPVS